MENLYITDDKKKQVINEVKKLGGMATLYKAKLALAHKFTKSQEIRETVFAIHGTLSPEAVILHWLIADMRYKGRDAIITFLNNWKGVTIKDIKDT